MEYERYSGGAIPPPTMNNTHRWVSLSGPVGRRGRITQVTNSNQDQQNVIDLLAAIPRIHGGMKEHWQVTPLAGPSGSCPQFLADVIWDFQSLWKRIGIFKNIDGVVDPGGNTLKQLNFLASAAKMSS